MGQEIQLTGMEKKYFHMLSENSSPSPVPVVLQAVSNQMEEGLRGFKYEFMAKSSDILHSEHPVCLQVLCEPYQAAILLQEEFL